MDSFSVGERAIYVRQGSRHYGEEVVIKSPLHMTHWYLEGRYHAPTPCYDIADLDGKKQHWVAEPHELRKKRPPEEYDGNRAGEWDLCPWRPSKERVA